MEENQQMTKRERKEQRQEERRREEVKQYRSRSIKKWTKITIFMLLLAVSIGGFVWYGATRPVVPTGELFSVKSDDWTKGSQSAQVTLIEYLDFECEACGQYYPLVKRLSEEFKDEVTFVTRYFPLPGHKNSQTSASAVEAAGKQGKYWEMHNIVFENQNSWGEKPAPTPKVFEGYAEKLGLDMVKFKKDIDSEEVKNRIDRDKSSGTKLGIQGTPTFFLNGEKIQNPRGYEDFKTLVQSAISKTTKENNESKVDPTIY